MVGSVEAAVLDSEKRRCAAMLANDAEQLEPLLDERLIFNHATGAADGKAAYLTKIAGGRIRYVAIDWADESVVMLGSDAALLSGRMTTIVTVEGIEKTLENRVLAAWTLAEGAWRLVAFQSTPLKA